MNKFIISPGFEADVRENYNKFPFTRTHISDVLALIKEAENDKLIFNMFFKAYKSRPPKNNVTSCDWVLRFDVCEVRVLHNDGYMLDRLKIFSSGHTYNMYRVIYFADDIANFVHLFALMNRAVDYDLEHPLIKRIKHEYLMLYK